VTAKSKVHVVPPPAREAFKLYVKAWQEKLGLMDWRVHISEKHASKTTMAEVHDCDHEARLATIRLGRDFGGTPVDEQSIEATALHELLHILMHEFKTLCQADRQDETAINSAEHRIIHTFEHILTGSNG
jgi:hypothetical protein